MLAVVKTPRINIRLEGDIPEPILKAIRAEYGKKLEIKEQEETVPLSEWPWYQKMKKSMTPGKNLRVYRDNASLTQEQLGAKVGVSRKYISDLENGHRNISKDLAKKFMNLFKVPIDRFI